MYRPYSSSLADSRPFPDVESLIRGLTQDFVTAFNTGNYDQMAALYAPDGVLMAPNYDPAYGPKAVESLLRKFGEAGYGDLRVETVLVENSGSMAMEIGRYTLSVRQGNGTTVVDRGKSLKVWRRLGVWLIVADCWNSNLAAGAGN